MANAFPFFILGQDASRFVVASRVVHKVHVPHGTAPGDLGPTGSLEATGVFFFFFFLGVGRETVAVFTQAQHFNALTGLVVLIV